MTPSLISLAGLILLMILILMRIPISFSFFIVSFIGILFLAPSSTGAINLFVNTIWNEFSSFTLGVIPFYIFMGEIIFRTGTSQSLFEASYRWFGHLRGGLAY